MSNASIPSNKTSAADRLFQALSSDVSRLTALQKILKPTQLMPVMGIVSAVMAKKPVPANQTAMLLRSIDEKQKIEFKKQLPQDQYDLLLEAIEETK